jgi:hypothetical protein
VYLGCQEIQVKPDWVLANPLHWLDLLARLNRRLGRRPRRG